MQSTVSFKSTETDQGNTKLRWWLLGSRNDKEHIERRKENGMRI